MKGVSVQMPDNFRKLKEGELAVVFPSPEKPMMAFADPQNVAKLGINDSYTEWNTDDLDLLKNFYKATISSLFTNINYITDTIKTLNEKKFISIEFTSELEPLKQSYQNKSKVKHYHYIQYTLIDGKVYVFNFTCPDRFRSKWQPAAYMIMNSIKVKN
jgi:hypothetical protein